MDSSVRGAGSTHGCDMFRTLKHAGILRVNTVPFAVHDMIFNLLDFNRREGAHTYVEGEFNDGPA